MLHWIASPVEKEEFLHDGFSDVMFVLFLIGVAVRIWAEQSGNPALAQAGLNQSGGDFASVTGGTTVVTPSRCTAGSACRSPR